MKANQMMLTILLVLISTVWMKTVPIKLENAKQTDIEYASGIQKNYFYVNAADDNELNQRVLTLKVKEQDKIVAFRGIYMKDIKEEDVMKHMPIEMTVDSFKYIKTEYANYYHMIVEKKDDADKDAFYLIYLELSSEGSTEESKRSIVVSSESENNQMFGPEQSRSFTIGDYIPTIIKYTLVKDIGLGDSVMFYTPEVKYQTVIEGSVLKIKSFFCNQLYIYTFPDDAAIEYTANITLIYFGPTIYINQDVKITFSKTLFLHDVVQDNEIYHIELANPENPFILLKEYSLQTNPFKQVIYIERLFGDFKVSHRTSIDKSSFPELFEINPSNPYYLQTTTKVDWITLKADSPSGFNIHFIKNYEDTEISQGEYKHFLLKKDVETIITLPQPAEGETIKYEIRSHSSDITINKFDTQEEVFKDISSGSYTNDKTKYQLAFKNKNNDAFINIKIKSKTEYTPIPQEGPMVNHGYISLENKEEISKIIVSLEKKAEKDIQVFYSFGYGPFDMMTDPKFNKFYLNDKQTWNIINSELQTYPLTSLPDSKFYLQFRVENDDKDGIVFKMTTEQKPEKSIALAKSEPHLIQEQGYIKLDSDNRPNDLLVIILNKCKKGDSEMKLKYYDKSIKSYFIHNTLNLFTYDTVFRGMYAEIMPILKEDKFHDVLLYYSYFSLAEYTNIIHNKFNDDFSITTQYIATNNTHTNYTFTWASPLRRHKEAVVYKIYIYNDREINKETFDLCKPELKDGLKPYIEMSTEKASMSIFIALNKTAENNVFIVAQPTTSLKVKFGYTTIRIPQEIGGVDPMKLTWLYIIIGVLCVIIIGMGIGYCFVYKKRRDNGDINEEDMPSNALIETA